MSIDLPAGRSTVSGKTRPVTITGSGNNCEHIGALTVASMLALFRGLSPVRRRIASWTDPATVDARFEALRFSLTSCVPGVRAGERRETGVMLDYLAEISTDNALIASRLDAATAEWARATARPLSERSRALADAEGCVSLAVRASSHDGQARSAEPWTHLFRYPSRGVAPSAGHATGMRAPARMLDELLGVQAA